MREHCMNRTQIRYAYLVQQVDAASEVNYLSSIFIGDPLTNDFTNSSIELLLAQRKISGDKLFLLLLHHGTV